MPRQEIHEVTDDPTLKGTIMDDSGTRTVVLFLSRFPKAEQGAGGAQWGIYWHGPEGPVEELCIDAFDNKDGTYGAHAHPCGGRVDFIRVGDETPVMTARRYFEDDDLLTRLFREADKALPPGFMSFVTKIRSRVLAELPAT